MIAIVLVAACMILAGAVLLWVLLRSNDKLRPQGCMEWTGTVLSVLLILCAGLLMALALANMEQEVMAESGLDQPAVDITFKLLSDDATQRLSGYEGQVVLLNFWATWCQPCVTELPELDRLQTNYAEQGLTVITISDEDREILEMFEDLWPKHTVSGYVSPDSVPEPYYSELIVGRPISYVIDRDGISREFILGAGNYELFEQYIRPHI